MVLKYCGLPLLIPAKMMCHEANKSKGKADQADPGGTSKFQMKGRNNVIVMAL